MISQSLTSRTETTAVIKWTADNVADYIWYSINDVSWIGINVADGTNGSYTVTGLNANTTYRIKTRVRRKDTQTTEETSVLTFTTYAYPHALNMPDFIVGEAVTIGIFNPLGRSVTVVMTCADGLQAESISTTGASVTGYNSSAAAKRLLASVPDSKYGTYTVRVTYGGISDTRTGGRYTVNVTPKIGSIGYADTNSSVTAITHDNQQIVQNQSVVRFTALGLYAGQGARLTECYVTVNGARYNLAVSGTTATGGDMVIDSGSDLTATLTLTDSRGLTATKNITVTMLAWTLPSAIVELQRVSNYYTETDITVNAECSDINGANSVVIKCRYKKVDEVSYSSWVTLTDEVTTTLSLDNTYAWNVQVSVTDLFGSTTYNAVVPVGMPIVFYDTDKHSTGFNCFPVNDNSVEINGVDVLKQLFYQPGESVTISNVFCGGVVSNAGKSLFFSVVLPKSLSGRTVNVTTLKLNVWNTSGGYTLSNAYVDGGYDVLADSTITVTKTVVLENTITFVLTKSSAYNGTNNTPQAVRVEKIVLSLG